MRSCATSGNHTSLSERHCSWMLMRLSMIAHDRQELITGLKCVVEEGTLHARRTRDGASCLYASHGHAKVFSFQYDSDTQRVKMFSKELGNVNGQFFLDIQALRMVLNGTG